MKIIFSYVYSIKIVIAILYRNFHKNWTSPTRWSRL